MEGKLHTSVALIRSTFPNLDKDVVDYMESVLSENSEHFESVSDVHDAVGGLLNGYIGEKSEGEIDTLCRQIYDLIKPCRDDSNDNGTLDAPIQMANLLNTFNKRLIDNNSIWMAKRESSSVVDLKKLEKAEAKIKEKQERKGLTGKYSASCSSQSIKSSEKDDFATVSQQIDRRDVNSSLDASGRHVGDIRLENFDVSFGSRVLLKGANLTVTYGKRYGLVGRNGYGKTTLLRAIARGDLRLPAGLRILHVEQEMTGDSTSAIDSVLQADVERCSLLAELEKLQSTSKRPTFSIDEDEENEGNSSARPSNKGTANRLTEIYNRLSVLEADKAPVRAAVILYGLGFTPEMQKRATKEFSGGWRMRLSLAQALFAKPDVLLLDEPTNMLDMRALIWLEDYLQTTSNILIIVSHDRVFLNAVATDIIHLTDRRLDSYRGNYDSFEKARSEKLLAQQREYEAQKAERDHIQQFIDKFRYNAKRASLVQSRIKQLERMPSIVLPEKNPKVVIRLPVCEKLSSPVLRLDLVSFHYTADKPILQNVDLSISSSSRICIVGENGAGKTTLLRLLLGQLEPTSGLRNGHRSLRVGYFSQHHVDQLDLRLNSLEFLMRKFPSQTEQTYRSQLAGFNITDMLVLQPIGSLSGGQKSRVAFAAMCMANPNFLVLDEPTNHLDVETIAALADALNAFQGGVVIVSHDERLIESVCNEVWVCTRMTAGNLGKVADDARSSQGSRVFALPNGLSDYKTAVKTELDQVKK